MKETNVNMQFKFVVYTERSKREGEQTIQRKFALDVWAKLPRHKPVLDGMCGISAV